MTSRFDPAPSQAGFTLYEALIALAILSLVLGSGIAVFRPPSPTLQAQAQIAQLIRDANAERQLAVRQRTDRVWRPDTPTCDSELESELVFFANGSATGPVLCVLNFRVAVHRMTGLLKQVSE